MQEFTDLNALLAAVKRRIGDAPRAIIAIEGHSASGKSYLSEDLAERLGAAAVGTDSYARDRSKAPTYVERIQLDSLAVDIDRLTEAGLVIIEGICLRDTLREIAIVPTAFIYLKVITVSGLWRDEVENYLEDGQPSGNWTDRQSVEYHLRENPHDRADFVYVRLEELPTIE
jgi:hypothetical protein